YGTSTATPFTLTTYVQRELMQQPNDDPVTWKGRRRRLRLFAVSSWRWHRCWPQLRREHAARFRRDQVSNGVHIKVLTCHSIGGSTQRGTARIVMEQLHAGARDPMVVVADHDFGTVPE